MALSSSLSFLVPHPAPDLLLQPVVVIARPSAVSACSNFPLWVSSERSQFAVVGAKGKQRETMDFEFLDDDDGMAEEDRVPDHIVNMEEWMRNRPTGFGVGKVYDLELEEKLLAEIEADRKAQEAAKRNKGNNKGKITPKKAKVTAEAPAGVEVWVGNLPRKRKVDRDLRTAFRNAPGLLHIRPIVEPENEKTRDPMCRGFAFFTFATEDDAYDFVSMYSGVKVKFGKVEKKVACEVAKSDSPWHPKPDRRAAIPVPKLQVRDTEESSSMDPPSLRTLKDTEESSSMDPPSLRTLKDTEESSFEEEEEEEEEDDDVSEPELRAMEEAIWDQFEDEDDVALDLELSQEEEPPQTRSADEETSASSDLDEEEYSVEKIRALEAKVKEMERKLQLSAQNEEERVALLEKRVLSKAKLAAVGTSGSKAAEGEKKKAGAKKKKAPAEKKTPKPKKIGNLGSAHRLKAKDRAVLTGVMSKYASTAP